MTKEVSEWTFERIEEIAADGIGAGFKSPWSLGLFNCTNGRNELRTSEIFRLIADLESDASLIERQQQEIARKDEALLKIAALDYWHAAINGCAWKAVTLAYSTLTSPTDTKEQANAD